MRLLVGVLFVLTALGGGVRANEAKRLALVIGNNIYSHFDADHQLKKAVNDAKAVGDALERDGFAVTRGADLSRSDMVNALYDFAARIEPGDTAFVYFAGHGVALGGGNYLLPSDVPQVGAGQEARVASLSLAEADVVATLTDRGARVAIVVLDACRDNPFKRPGMRSAGLDRGLARATEISGVFSLYSAGFGQSALDRLSDDDPNPNSVFTRVLVPLLTRPGLNLDDLAYEVRENVARLAATVPGDHQQVPAAYDQILGGRVYLAGPPAEPAPAPRLDEMAWSFVETTTDPKQVEAFVARFPQSAFRGKAEVRLAELRSMQVASLPKPIEAKEGIASTAPQSPVVPPASQKPAQAATPPDPSIAECDRLAADPDDPQKPAGVVGVDMGEIDVGKAVPACRGAVAARPDDLHLKYQLGRALKAIGGDAALAEAAALFRVLTEGGDVAATSSLAGMYRDGIGVEKDAVKSLELYRRAAEAGDVFAMSQLGFHYLMSSDAAEAARWTRKAAEGGEPASMANLAGMYASGAGVPKDEAEALRWNRKSADAGFALGFLNLGIAYRDGAGVTKDPTEAARWFRKTADAGLVTGMTSLIAMAASGSEDAKREADSVRWFDKAADAREAGYMYDVGLALMGGPSNRRSDLKEDVAQAAQWFRKAADGGSAPGMAKIGFMYLTGQGVAKDVVKGVSWFRKSADGKNAYGMRVVAYLLSRGIGVAEDRTESQQWYRKAADAGDSLAMVEVGTMFEKGSGVTKDEVEAARWFYKSAEAGSPSGLYNEGRIYANGIGVTKDEANAARWFRRAADAGNAESMNSLGFQYEFGIGVAEDVNEAARWFRKAADAGATKDEAEAARWFRTAADMGNPTGMVELARAYRDGTGVDRDLAEAAQWFRKAADAGSAPAMTGLGSLYWSGAGVVKDDAEGAAWFRKAAEAGDTRGMNLFGNMLRDGIGVTKDTAEARRWYQKAADVGDSEGVANISSLDASLAAKPAVVRETPKAPKQRKKAAKG